MSKVQWVGETVSVPAPKPSFKITLGGPKLIQLGEPADVPGTDWGTLWYILSVVGMGLSAYHGYARNKSVGWGIGWGVAGAIAPIITVPIALAQGFAKPASSAAFSSNPRAKMTKAEAVAEFRAYVLPGIVEQYGRNDRPAIEQGWNDWTDGLMKDGRITVKQYETWTHPF